MYSKINQVKGWKTDLQKQYINKVDSTLAMGMYEIK